MGSAVTSWKSPTPRALVADAEQTGRIEVESALQRGGWTIVTAQTLREVEQIVRRKSPQLLFCDTSLQPEAIGDLTCRLHEASTSSAASALVLTSGRREIGLRLAGLRAGATDFVLKSAGGYIHATRGHRKRLRSAAAPGRILVVDDSPTYGNALIDALTLDGHDVVLAASVAEAKDYLSLQTPDVALLDVYLPDGDGVDLAQELRAQASTRELPIMMLTGCESKLVRQRASGAGVSAFSAKNVSMNLLRERVGALRSGRRPLDPEAPMQSQRGPQAREMTSAQLFAALLSMSGLSAVLGRSTLELAFKHAGVNPKHLTVAGLRQALPDIERALTTFQSPGDAAARMSEIRAFVGEGSDGI